MQTAAAKSGGLGKPTAKKLKCALFDAPFPVAKDEPRAGLGEPDLLVIQAAPVPRDANTAQVRLDFPEPRVTPRLDLLVRANDARPEPFGQARDPFIQYCLGPATVIRKAVNLRAAEAGS